MPYWPFPEMVLFVMDGEEPDKHWMPRPLFPEMVLFVMDGEELEQ